MGTFHQEWQDICRTPSVQRNPLITERLTNTFTPQAEPPASDPIAHGDSPLPTTPPGSTHRDWTAGRMLLLSSSAALLTGLSPTPVPPIPASVVPNSAPQLTAPAPHPLPPLPIFPPSPPSDVERTPEQRRRDEVDESVYELLRCFARREHSEAVRALLRAVSCAQEYEMLESLAPHLTEIGLELLDLLPQHDPLYQALEDGVALLLAKDELMTHRQCDGNSSPSDRTTF